MKGTMMKKVMVLLLAAVLLGSIGYIRIDAAQTGLTVFLLSEDLSFFQAKIKEPEFKKMLPNVQIDFQQTNSADQMMNTFKIRQSANEMPDVFYLKPAYILQLSSSLSTWASNDKLAKNNKFVSTYAVNKAPGGKYYGLPMKVFSDWVYYRKSIFNELGLKVPTTWNKFIDVAKKIKVNGKYISIAMGAKDIWPTYPFNEFMPHAISGDPDILSHLAKKDEPFGPGSAFYKAYDMADQLYKLDVMGNPLGTSWPEAEQLFTTKKAAMMVIGQYFLPDYEKNGGDMKDVAVYPLPIFNDKPTNCMGMIDLFWTVAKNSKHPKEARKFIEWFFSPSVYKNYITQKYMISTIKGIDADNIFSEAHKLYKFKDFMYVPGNEDYVKLMSETQWDTKTIGSEMMAGKGFKEILSDFNKKWKAARAKLRIQ